MYSQWCFGDLGHTSTKLKQHILVANYIEQNNIPTQQSFLK